jgi:hypothetical protein
VSSFELMTLQLNLVGNGDEGGKSGGLLRSGINILLANAVDSVEAR